MSGPLWHGWAHATSAIGAALLVLGVVLYASGAPAQDLEASLGISANPGASSVLTGTGRLGRLLGFDKDSGVRLGGAWIGNTSYLFSGGVEPQTWSFNSLLLVDLSLDLEKLLKIPDAQFGVEFLQFNGQPSNQRAGSVTGYDGLSGQSPFVRSELYELWWRQRLFDDKVIFRIGKTVPTYDFNNVTRPLGVDDESLIVPSLSGLLYTPIFKNPTLIGVMAGYYNSAYGFTLTLAPTKDLYASVAVYDGNLARGVQTGLNAAPQFNGYYFMVGEVGYSWLVGTEQLPGTVAVGVWRQTGELSSGGISEDGAKGLYAFASQRLWRLRPGVDNAGISGFFQFGINDSDTMIAHRYVGAGLTGFGLIPKRSKDSMGVGVAASWLNQALGFRKTEVLLQTYYQMHMVWDVYVQPTLTYVPNPGAGRRLTPATVFTLQGTVLF